MMPGFTAARALDSNGTHHRQRARVMDSSGVGDAIEPAMRIQRRSHRRVRRDCGAGGGVYWSEGPTTATYGCMYPDGSGIVCGGRTRAEDNSCDTF